MEQQLLQQPPGHHIDLVRLKTFERKLIPHRPEKSSIPARVLGYGEISTVFAIEAFEGLAFKRLPIFETWQELAIYCTIYKQYNDLLVQAGIHVAPHGHAAFLTDTGRPVFYIIQHLEPGFTIGHHALHHLTPTASAELFEHLLLVLKQIWVFNRGNPTLELAIDGQISNWSILHMAADGTLPDDLLLRYLDTSTPLFRVNGVEQLDPELFLRSAPSFLRWILRLFFLEDVIDRYYDLRLVTIDLIANLYKDGHSALIPAFIATANKFFATHAAEFAVPSLTYKEIDAYYKEDAFIWRLYLGLRRLDRTLHHALRREYPYILPGKIKR